MNKDDRINQLQERQLRLTERISCIDHESAAVDERNYEDALKWNTRHYEILFIMYSDEKDKSIKQKLIKDMEDIESEGLKYIECIRINQDDSYGNI